MDKISWLYVAFIFVTIAFLILLNTVRKINNDCRKIAQLSVEMAIKQNLTTYNMARFILAYLQAKSEERNLTVEEQEYFHQARRTVNEYETAIQQGKL